MVKLNPEDFGNDFPFITPGDFTKSGKYIIKTDRQLSRIGVHRLKNKTVPKDSIIVTCIGSDMSKVAITSEDSITNQQINAIVVAQKELSEYLFHRLNAMSNELKSMALGSSTMPLLNKSEFEKISIPIPPSDKLLIFSQFTDVTNKTIIIKLKENNKLTELQSLLLAKMG
ncbi:MAG: restriction endonuclease subunit S [Bacteroidales bacterium]|nr:restriction endonuclease subunit S [Bacteroidales bacterium]